VTYAPSCARHSGHSSPTSRIADGIRTRTAWSMAASAFARLNPSSVSAPHRAGLWTRLRMPPIRNRRSSSPPRAYTWITASSCLLAGRDAPTPCAPPRRAWCPSSPLPPRTRPAPQASGAPSQGRWLTPPREAGGLGAWAGRSCRDHQDRGGQVPIQDRGTKRRDSHCAAHRKILHAKEVRHARSKRVVRLPRALGLDAPVPAPVSKVLVRGSPAIGRRRHDQYVYPKLGARKDSRVDFRISAKGLVK
jgi:hypothetical protein